MTPAVILEIIRGAIEFGNSAAGQKMIIEIIDDSNKLEARLEKWGGEIAAKWKALTDGND